MAADLYNVSQLDTIQSRAGFPRPYGFWNLKLYLTRLQTAIVKLFRISVGHFFVLAIGC
jgi:hypothetical protein